MIPSPARAKPPVTAPHASDVSQPLSSWAHTCAAWPSSSVPTHSFLPMPIPLTDTAGHFPGRITTGDSAATQPSFQADSTCSPKTQSGYPLRQNPLQPASAASLFPSRGYSLAGVRGSAPKKNAVTNTYPPSASEASKFWSAANGFSTGSSTCSKTIRSQGLPVACSRNSKSG